MENIRGKRSERCVSADDKEVVLIDKKIQQPYGGFYMNIFNKIYWFDEEWDIIWFKEDRYDEYEIKEVSNNDR